MHQAAERLKERVFQSDKYHDRQAPAYWTGFQFPSWWTNLLTALDTLSLLGYPGDDETVQRGLCWFVENQQADGLWHTAYEQKKCKKPSAREREAMVWVSLAIYWVLKRFGSKGRISWTGN